MDKGCSEDDSGIHVLLGLVVCDRKVPESKINNKGCIAAPPALGALVEWPDVELPARLTSLHCDGTSLGDARRMHLGLAPEPESSVSKAKTSLLTLLKARATQLQRPGSCIWQDTVLADSRADWWLRVFAPQRFLDPKRRIRAPSIALTAQLCARSGIVSYRVL